MTSDKLGAIIIDDEEKGRKLLRNLLRSYCPDVKVLALADSVVAGVEAIERSKPNLIFLDIVMPRENGFALLDQIQGMPCEIIFTTAYSQYAIRAIRACALDYLLKPIDVDELQAAVRRAHEKFIGKEGGGEADERLRIFLENYQASDKQPQKMGFPTAHGVKFYPINKIFYCKAEGNYTTVYIEGATRLELVAKTLKEFEELLADHNFIRTHRSYLVNLDHLREYRRFGATGDVDGEGGCVIMTDNLQVPVSRDKRKILLSRISKPF